MKQIIIIGNSAAGIAAVEAIRNRDKTSKIVIISDEDYPAYCRCLISYYLAGDINREKMLYRPESFYKENNIEVILGKKVIGVQPKKNRIIVEDKSVLHYDSLLIATGASPKFPQDIKGIKKRGVLGLRTIKDTEAILGLLPVTKTVCVLGGGLIGLKAACALKKRNIEVKVIIKSKQVLSQMLDSQAASLVQKRLEEKGVELILGQDVNEIIGNGDIKAVKLDSGRVIGCTLVIVAKGVSPNTGLIKDTEIKVNEGIIANNLLETNLANIYVAGDVCESFDLTIGKSTVNALWPIAVEQGRLAGANMSGDNLNYAGSLGMNSIAFFGMPIVSLGIYKTGEGNVSVEELKDYDRKNNIYKKFVLKNNVLVGTILIGDIKNSGVFLRLMRERIDVSSLKERLFSEGFGYSDIMDFIKDKERIYV